MDKFVQADLTGAKEFLAKELRSVMERQKVSAHPNSLSYLVELVVRYMSSDNFFVKSADGHLEENFLVDLYANYLQGGPEIKRQSLQRLGDICLLVTGFFSDSLKRKIVDVDYYFGMGGNAYWQLSHFHVKEIRPLFIDLATQFRPFSNVLSEVSERGGLQNNSDILRLYERWLLTGSERLKTLLSEKGIVAFPMPDAKIKH